jgi:hypothetical protein
MPTENENSNEDPETPVTVADKPREPTEYERQLRRESAKHRTEAKAARDALETFKTESQTRADEIRNSVTAEANQRVIRAELKAAALKAGMVDLDGLKLLDLSTVKMNDKGEIDGADALMAKAKETKPYLFGSTTNTSSTTVPPNPDKGEVKLARDMTPEERAAAKAKLLGR